MPASRNGRASKACTHCRKHKTRCYSSQASCLRCETLSLECSLSNAPLQNQQRITTNRESNSIGHTSTDTRLEKLEAIVQRLVDKLEPAASRDDVCAESRWHDSMSGVDTCAHSDCSSHPAPVFLIRDAGIESTPAALAHCATLAPDVISTGLVSLEAAKSLVSLFHLHYGRWIRLPEDIPAEKLLLQVRTSPLLLCSILLIAVRHTTDQLTERLAPRLFDQVKRLLGSELLVVPQHTQFFQATIVLSLWSTTIGHAPLSIDGWAITSYAIQQTLASPLFIDAVGVSPASLTYQDTRYLWNHLVLAHLQACVGMQRVAMVTPSQINRCVQLAELTNGISNYEMRMVAEVELYWIIYQQCCQPLGINIRAAKRAFQEWHQHWHRLFDAPRSQFLQLGIHFAYLFAHYQSTKTSIMRAAIPTDTLLEMVRLCKEIIALVMATADERVKHLTDHIYHLVTFAALVLCRLVHNCEQQLLLNEHNLVGLCTEINSLIIWFKTIGLDCHIAQLLGNIILAQFQKLTPTLRRQSSGSDISAAVNLDTNATATTATALYTQSIESIESMGGAFDITDLFPNLFGVELFSSLDHENNFL